MADGTRVVIEQRARRGIRTDRLDMLDMLMDRPWGAGKKQLPGFELSAGETVPCSFQRGGGRRGGLRWRSSAIPLDARGLECPSDTPQRHGRRQ